ncbi:sodium:solute symporter family protein [Amycolatopsis minnesotensis]|uniref:Sodium/proline symporter PutP n=1 Tax=Amycolatopsis minnesotensis TaxID=337894 RepID=A0ABP5C1G7_9PSEU
MHQGTTGQIVAIVLISIVIVGIGALLSMYFGRRAKSSADWLAAPESLPLGVVVITQFATAVGGGVLIAHVGIAYSSGWSVFAYEGSVLLGFLGLALIAKWLREQSFTTVPDILTKLFGRNRTVTVVAGFAALIVPFGWLATQFVSFAKLFGQLTGIPTAVLVLAIMLGSLVFVLPGGLTSVAWTDFVFGIFKILMSLVIAGYAIYLAGGWSGITSRVPERLWSVQGIGAAGSEQIWLWIAAIVPGTLTNQLYYQRVFATKKVRDARRGLVLSGLTILVAGVYAGCIGLAVRAMSPGLANPEQAAGWLLTRLPTALLVLFGAFLVATIISTTGAALQSVVANLTRDLYQNVFGGTRGDRATISLSRLFSAGVAVLAAALAIAFPSALGWLVASYAYSAAALAAPIFLGFTLHKRFTLRPAAALASMIAGIAGCAVAQLADTSVPYAVYGIVSSALVLAVVGIGTRVAVPAPSTTDMSNSESQEIG